MKTLGSGSLASVLKVVLDIVWYLAWALLGFAALVLLATGATLVMDWLGYSPGFVTDLLGAIRNLGWVYPILVAEIIAGPNFGRAFGCKDREPACVVAVAMG